MKFIPNLIIYFSNSRSAHLPDSTFLLQFDQLLHAVVHDLDSLKFRQTEASFVRDVVDATSALRVFAVDTSRLQLQIIADFLEVRLRGHFRDLDVHRRADGGAQVGWTESQPTEAIVAREWHGFFDDFDASDQTIQNFANVTTVLHRNDTQVIFFIDPDQEGFVLVVENTASTWPVTARVGSLQESIAFFEQEMISDQLILNIFRHSGQRVVGSLQLRVRDGGEDFLNFLFHFFVMRLRQARIERVASDRTAASDASGLDELPLRVQVLQFADVRFTEIGCWLTIRWFESAVVILDDGVEEFFERRVGFGVRGVNAAPAVQVLDAGLDDVPQRCSQLGLFPLQLVDDIFRQVFLQQRMTILGVLKGFVPFFDFLNRISIGHLSLEKYSINLASRIQPLEMS
jgi:hypothetical protein